MLRNPNATVTQSNERIRKRKVKRICQHRLAHALALRDGQHLGEKSAAVILRLGQPARNRQGEIAAPGGQIEHAARLPALQPFRPHGAATENRRRR